ncbi:hypothetical protein BVI2075_320249 [Burkholderia vietnamiensis]|nr:hypothetical protein BVI2075_320249 [Burkholderia vietnamiensis]
MRAGTIVSLQGASPLIARRRPPQAVAPVRGGKSAGEHDSPMALMPP